MPVKNMRKQAGLLAVLLVLAGLAAELRALSPPGQDQAIKKKLPQAKGKEEYESYLATVNAPTASQAETSAREFETKYPNSELLSTVYQEVMAKYQQSANTDKTIEMGRKAVKFDPDNAIALVMTSTLLAEGTRETDIDRDVKLKEAADDANRALRAVDSGNFYLGANATPDQIAAFKDTVTCMASGALGQSELLRHNFAAAEQQFQKSVATQRGGSDPSNWMRLAQAQEAQKRYSEALNAANKAVALAPPNSPLASAAAAAQARLKELAGH
jgi:tetratricopeptide (TPR) repeat protein